MNLREEIEKVAYELFERGGREHGKDKEHWLEAERIVKATHEAEKRKAEGRKMGETAGPATAATRKAQATKAQQSEPKQVSAPYDVIVKRLLAGEPGQKKRGSKPRASEKSQK
jgi:hypothetical protein